MTAVSSSTSSSSGSLASQCTRPRIAGAGQRAPADDASASALAADVSARARSASALAAGAGASALAADLRAICTSAPRPTSAACAGSKASSPSTTGTSSAGGLPARRRACEPAGCDAANRQRSRGTGSSLHPSSQSESAMDDGAGQASSGSSASPSRFTTAALSLPQRPLLPICGSCGPTLRE